MLEQGIQRKRMIKECFDKVSHTLAEEIKKYYGHRLASIVVFGSVARETYRADSDMDILLIANSLPKGRMKRIAEFMKKHICPCIEYDFCNVWVNPTVA